MRMKNFYKFVIVIVLIDCLLPFLLGLGYPEYNHLTMVISALGSNQSPVRIFFYIWMAILGVSFMFIGIQLYRWYRQTSKVLSLVLLVITIIYAVCDCVISSIFSIGNSKEMNTLPEILHGYGSAIGCTLFVLGGLIAALLLKKSKSRYTKVLLVSFVLALVTFTIFVTSENVSSDAVGVYRIFGFEGLWQRISFVFMYIPFVILSKEYMTISQNSNPN